MCLYASIYDSDILSSSGHQGDSIPILWSKPRTKTCLQVPVKDSNNLSGASNDSNNLSSASRWLKKLLWSK